MDRLADSSFTWEAREESGIQEGVPVYGVKITITLVALAPALEFKFVQETDSSDGTPYWCTYIGKSFSPGSLSFHKEVAYKKYLAIIEKYQDGYIAPQGPEVLETQFLAPTPEQS